jgi:hypothetical protein
MNTMRNSVFACALLLAVNACDANETHDDGPGGSGGQGAAAGEGGEGGEGGAGGDAGMGGEGGSPVTESLTLLSRTGLPVAGIDVLAHAADGSVVAETTTDTAGVATLDVPDGGIITALYVSPNDEWDPTMWFTQRAVSFHAVAPGASYVHQLDTREPEAALPQPMTLSYTFTSLPGTANSVAIMPNCGGPSVLPDDLFTGSLEIQHYGCPGHAEVELMVLAYDYPSPNAHGLYRLPPTTFTAGGAASFTVAAADFVAPTPITFSYDAIDVLGISALGATGGIQLPSGQWLGGDYAGVLDPPTASGTFDLLVPPGVNSGYAYVNSPPYSGLRPRAEIFWRGDGLAPLPTLTPASATVSDPYNVGAAFEPDAKRPLLSCSMPQDPVGDVLLLDLRWYAGNNTHNWYHYGPLSALDLVSGQWNVTTPALPADKDDFTIGAASQLSRVRCANIDSSASTGPETATAPLPDNATRRSQETSRNLDQ